MKTRCGKNAVSWLVCDVGWILLGDADLANDVSEEHY